MVCEARGSEETTGERQREDDDAKGDDGRARARGERKEEGRKTAAKATPAIAHSHPASQAQRQSTATEGRGTKSLQRGSAKLEPAACDEWMPHFRRCAQPDSRAERPAHRHRPRG